MGWMENESGGSRLAEVLVFLFFFVKAIPSFSPLSFPFLVSVLNTSHYHTLLSCPLGCLAAEFYFFYFYLFVTSSTQIFLRSVLASLPLWSVGFSLGYIFNTCHLCYLCYLCLLCLGSWAFERI